jgi:hypothetical protein
MKRILAIAMVCSSMSLGCGPRREASESASVLQQKESTFQLTLLFDMSGSFEPLMAQQGKAYEFAMHCFDRYFKSRIGMDDEIIIAKIAGSSRALMWQGTPQQLRQDFPSAAAFREMLTSVERKATIDTFQSVKDAQGNVFLSGSNVHECIVKTLGYALSEPGIADGRVKSGVFVCSDMLDSSPEPDKTKQEALEALTRFGQAGGVVGLYFVDQTRVGEWRGLLGDAGIKHWRVESEIVSRPILPEFE